VKQGSRGVYYPDFYEDYRLCSFTVVIHRDLESNGDVLQLGSRTEEARQLTGNSARIPRLPKKYDAEQKGHYGAETWSSSAVSNMDSLQIGRRFSYTIPFLNSSNEYLVPRQTTPC
jgi:hypothetical protein